MKLTNFERSLDIGMQQPLPSVRLEIDWRYRGGVLNYVLISSFVGAFRGKSKFAEVFPLMLLFSGTDVPLKKR